MIDARDHCFDYCSVNTERKTLYGTGALRMCSFLKSEPDLAVYHNPYADRTALRWARQFPPTRGWQYEVTRYRNSCSRSASDISP